MNKPKISVILPVYNNEQFIEQAINSILSQTFTDWELIIIHDLTDDKSEAKIKAFSDKRIKYYQRNNQGLIYSLNEGLTLAQGEFIARQDADDFSDPTRFEKQVQVLDAHPELVLVGTLANVIDESNQILSTVYRPITSEQIQLYHIFETPFIHGSVMFRRKIIDEGVFYLNYFAVEDFEFWSRILEKGKGYNLAETLYNYRQHDTNASKVNGARQLNNAEFIRNSLQQKFLHNQAFVDTASFASFLDHSTTLSSFEKQHYGDLAYQFVLKLLLHYPKKAKQEYRIAKALKHIPLHAKFYYHQLQIARLFNKS